MARHVLISWVNLNFRERSRKRTRRDGEHGFTIIVVVPQCDSMSTTLQILGLSLGDGTISKFTAIRFLHESLESPWDSNFAPVLTSRLTSPHERRLRSAVGSEMEQLSKLQRDCRAFPHPKVRWWTPVFRIDQSFRRGWALMLSWMQC